MRSVHVIIATTLLLAPVVALTLTHVTAAAGQTVPTPLSLNLTPRTVRFGHRVKVNGGAPAADAGQRVVLETAPSPGASWRTVASARINRRGHFRFQLWPRRSGVIRAVEAAPSGGPTAFVASASAVPAPSAAVPSSAPAALTVAARFAVDRHQFAILDRGRIRVSGHLLPAIAGRRVRLQARIGRRWRAVAASRTGRHGGFGLRYAPGSATRRDLRVVFGGDGGNGRAVGSAGTVSVFSPSVASWYYDGGATACGFHAGLGVANRTLPCGTKVTLHYGGRTVTATVDDRGPYVGGRTWDLNQATAAALGFAGVGTVWVSG